MNADNHRVATVDLPLQKCMFATSVHCFIRRFVRIEMHFDWDPSKPDRFNPMDNCRHARIDIAVMEAIDALRAFVTGETGTRQMSNEDFANLLRASADSADRVVSNRIR